MGSDNGDQGDIPEDGFWSCPGCGAGGPCVKSDEAMLLQLHMLMAHPPADEGDED